MDEIRRWITLCEAKGPGAVKREFNQWLSQFNATSGPVWVDIVITGSNEITIESVTSEQKNRGFGNQAMTMLCALADKYHVSLTLQPVSYADYGNEADVGGLPIDDLIKWYKKFGFELNHETGQMTR